MFMRLASKQPALIQIFIAACKACCETLEAYGGVVGEGRSAFIGNSLERIRKNRDLFEVSLKGKEFKGKFFFCCSIKRARLYCLDLILRRFRFDGEILLLREREIFQQWKEFSHF